MKRLIVSGKARWPNLPCWENSELPQGEEPWEIDATDLTWIEPSGMVALAVKAMHINSRPQQIRIAQGDVCSYAQRMGLFTLLDQPLPYTMRNQPAGNRFKDLQVLRQNTRPAEASALCSLIAGVMASGIKEFEDLFSYVLGELTANVRQHAGKPGVVMAQSWPDGSVEFAIGDWGIGIRNGLSENPEFQSIGEQEALDVAIRPNTSGKDWPGAPRYGARENSGNGLFHLSFLAKEAPGRMLLVSGGWALYIHGTKKYTSALQCPLPGTLVSLRFNPTGIDQTRLLQEASKERGLAFCQNDLIFE